MSSADVIIAITEVVYQSLDKNGEIQTVALDISNVFDLVRHASLLQKFKVYGACERITGFI